MRNLLLRYKGGAKGVLHCSQISCGEENNLNIRVYGTKGSLAWQQEHPNELKFIPKDEPARILRRGNGYVSEVAKKFARLPAGHPRLHRGVREHLLGSHRRNPRQPRWSARDV